MPIYIEPLLKQKKGIKGIYRLLIRNTCLPTGQIQWDRILNIDSRNWAKNCEACFLTTKNSKLRWFQYRINHYILPTKVFLKKIGAE